MGLSVALEDGRVACADSIAGFLRAVDGLSEYDLLDVSRCHGWTRLDVVVHVIGGWEEMLRGVVSRVDSAPTVDAASYWTAFAAEFATDDPVPVLMSQRRRTAAWARPAAATAELHDIGAALQRGVSLVADTPCLWQGHVFAAGDFLAVWAVEHVVHQLDLRSEAPPPASALRLARATVESLVGEPLPSSWSDLDATLIGTGRVVAPDDSGALASRLPALG